MGAYHKQSARHGNAWKVQPSPNPGHDDFLEGVAATSSTNAWAVGGYYKGSTPRTLIERWHGKAWKVQPSPNPGGSAHSNKRLVGVAATSSTNAWAVGYCKDEARTLIERWHGKAWKVYPSPYLGGTDTALLGVAATTSTDAWAVGFWDDLYESQTVTERWNGTAWRLLPSPSPGVPGQTNLLAGVAATSSTNAWAVGYYTIGSGTPVPLIEHWDGTAWTVMPSPDPGTDP